MKMPVGNRRQAILLAVLAVILVAALVKWQGSPPSGAGSASSAARPAPSADLGEERAAGRTRAPKADKNVSPDEVPMVMPEDFKPPRGARESAGRNIFDFRPPTPTPIPTPRPVPTLPPMQGPPPPPSPPPTPTPPDITFRFIGTFGPKEHPIAVLVANDKLVNAQAGDVVFERFIVRRVGYESIDVGFVGFAPTETRRVGITP